MTTSSTIPVGIIHGLTRKPALAMVESLIAWQDRAESAARKAWRVWQIDAQPARPYRFWMGAAPDSRIGQVLGGAYRVERLIGEGGMGSVYEAQHLCLPRRFAIKLLNPQVLGNASAFERFQREAEIASSLGHEHIVQVFDFNHTDDGVPFMALELLQGEDLSTRLQRGRLTLAETAHF